MLLVQHIIRCRTGVLFREERKLAGQPAAALFCGVVRMVLWNGKNGNGPRWFYIRFGWHEGTGVRVTRILCSACSAFGTFGAYVGTLVLVTCRTCGA